MEIISIFIAVFGIINLIRLAIFSILTQLYGITIKQRKLLKPIYKIDDVSGTKKHYRYRPLVTVIIAARNEEKVIKRTLTALFNSTYKKLQVIVMNDGSKDNTEAEVLSFIKENPHRKIKYAYQENQGKAHALNNAIKKYATGKIIMCLDSDSVVKEDAIEKGVQYFRNRNTKAVATNVKILPLNTFFSLIQQFEYLMGYHLKKALTVGNIEYIIGGVGSMFRASTIRKIGAYSTDTVTEDIDLTMKVVRLGNKKNLLVYAEDVVVYTEGTLSPGAFFKQRFRWKFGRFQTFWKNRDLFFNSDPKYTKYLTFIYLPFQLYSELTFLFDPVFFIYILYLAILYMNPASYYGMFIFMMFFIMIAVVTDNESTVKRKIQLLSVSPLSYVIFFVVSAIEYAGLIKCVARWREIIYAERYNSCSWMPVERHG